MKPIEALMFALVKRFAPEFVPEPMRNDFEVSTKIAEQILADDAQLATWVEQKTARIDTWQGLLEPPQSDNDVLPTVSAAIFSELNLQISHHGKKGVMHHEVSPLAIVKRDEVLYVALRFAGYEDVRLLALHRIICAETVQTKPSAGNGAPFDLAAFLKSGLPFTLPGKKTFDLHLRLAESTYHSIKGRPLRNLSSISSPVDGWFEVEAKEVSNTMELRWWLLGLGDKVRIIEPESMARELQYLLFDPLTELLARRACQEHFERLIAAACRTESPLAVALVDIDHFKKINDELGHSTGDQVLQEVSRRLKDACRSMDVVGRWGGEEFLILLPETTVKDAAQLAERLRQAVGATPCCVSDHRISRTVTISIGVTAMSAQPQEKQSPTKLANPVDTLLKEADSALYKAKEVRNRVVLFGL